MHLESNLQGYVILLGKSKTCTRIIAGPPSKIKDHKPKRCFPENHLAARKSSRDAKVTRTTSYATWTALTSRPAKTRRTSVMISSLLLSASLRPTCKPMVFGRRMITKAKMQKGKKAKSKKAKSQKKGEKEGWLESRDANLHSKNENITIGGRRIPIVRK